MSRRKLETELTRALAEAREVQDNAGQELHGKVIPPLQVTAMMLQMIRLDHPETGDSIQQILMTLDDAMEEVRRLSGALAPSPVHRLGPKGALEKLVEERQSAFAGIIRFSWTDPPRGGSKDPTIAVELANDFLRQAVARKGAKMIRLMLRGTSIRGEVDGLGPLAPPSVIHRALAEYAGFTSHETSRRGTIVFTARRSGL